MGDYMGELANLGGGKLMIAAVVFVALVSIYNTIFAAWNNWRSARKMRDAPIEAIQKEQKRHAECLQRDKEHLEKHDRLIDENGEAVIVLLRATLATNQHLLNGNSVDKLRGSNEEIHDFLLKRK